MIGKISNIQRYSVNDGYGIRTIVFLMGCSMRCAWCQNPETIDGRAAVLMFIEESCARCGGCLPECPSGAISMKNGRIALDRKECMGCFKCVEACYFGARKPSGEEKELEAVFDLVMKDAAFFRNSGGGLTLSGGEPLLQSHFSRELLRLVKAEGIHTAVETAGNVSYAAFMDVRPYTDLFLYDLKLADDDLHKAVTGVSNKRILANLRQLAKTTVEIIVRVPLIPGVNDGGEFESIAAFAAALPGVRELHILPYHALGLSKYAQLGMSYPAQGTREENDGEVERCKNFAESLGLRVSVGGAGFAKRRREGVENAQNGKEKPEPQNRATAGTGGSKDRSPARS